MLIRLIHPERMTASKLLWIPDSAKRTNQELYHGTVVAVGPGSRTKLKEPFRCNDQTGTYSAHVTVPDVKPGDEVIFYWGAGNSAFKRSRWPDDEHVILDECHIMGVYEP